MTSGKPFSPNEIAFVRAHLHEKYPSVIARALGQYYPEDNGGSRSTWSVRELMKKLQEPEPENRHEKKAKPRS